MLSTEHIWRFSNPTPQGAQELRQFLDFMPPIGPQSNSSLRDNRTHRGAVGDFLKTEIQSGSHLSFVSAYFTVHAYEALASQLEGAAKLQFLFGEPSFVTGIDRGDKDKANFKLTEHGITIAKTLTQRPAAKACAEWIERMVEIRSIRQSNFPHGKTYHIENGNASSAILGSSNFTVPGLGLGKNSNIELNLVVDSDRDRKDLKAWFAEVWGDDSLTKDVRDEVLTYLKRLASPPLYEKEVRDALNLVRQLETTLTP